MTDAAVVAADISRIVQNSPQHHLLGSELAVLLRRGYPDFRAEDFGCRNIREFIRRFAKEVFESGGRGSDVLYSASLPPAVGESPDLRQEFGEIAGPTSFRPHSRIDAAVWKTFASPSAPYRIYAKRETGEFRVVRSGQAIQEGEWVLVPSCPAETHVQIAREFIQGLSDDLVKTQLTKILELDEWWNHFFFSARSFGFEKQWSAFRRNRLRSEFEKQLTSLGLRMVADSQSERLASAADAAVINRSGETDSQLHKIATAVIRRMPSSELRDLWLPLGYVLDELGEK